MEKESAAFLEQLISTLEEAHKKLEVSYNNGDAAGFNYVKKFILKAMID